ncbi:tetratricopeptide repeat-containing protein [Listeria cornellensis]|uniref:Uncharacterized protein n=1 Tax=Listeria cornellensis FSL F6-0969 TaxID=1265820 RepID=W7C2J2_9LIST|nr:tetratricopeptide repeat-containing protein [Listeria cornellensis]EUJ31460.1 hypothetical protein PCORN_05381 [Listeria cornellensis FSL F6-0969]
MKGNNVCFVIMGYGKKKDYRTGREVDMDFVYANLIKPAIVATGFICVRADEIKHSSMIDIPMYEHLMHANLVIADMSTTNFNAIYELGVRHAVRPQSTILISNKDFLQGGAPFDVNHISIFSYDDINTSSLQEEVCKVKAELIELVKAVASDKRIDSPIYSLIGDGITPPTMRTMNLTNPELDKKKKSLRELIQEGNLKLTEEKYFAAEEAFSAAMNIENSDYLVQRKVLSVYKNPHRDEADRYLEAIEILNQHFQVFASTDSEVLGLSGSIFKRLFELTDNKLYLQRAIDVCLKGFVINKNYYNGINLAYLHNLMAKKEEPQMHEQIANYYREQVRKICDRLIQEEEFDSREDCYWIYATLSEVYYCKKNIDMYKKNK